MGQYLEQNGRMSGKHLEKWRRRLLLEWIRPPWRWGVFAFIGIIAGLGAVTFNVSRATSYLSDDPETCINCHVMNSAYATWSHSAHREVATCNDCHVPHTNIFAEYAFKAQDGLRHSVIFTARAEPQAMRLSRAAVPVVHGNCIRCHEQTVMSIEVPRAEDQPCWHCHSNVPHGDVRSLSSTPGARRPDLPRAGWFRAGRAGEGEQGRGATRDEASRGEQ